MDLLRQSGESLAGRIAYLEMQPIDGLEVPASDAGKLWIRGGFPDSYLASSDRASLRWRQDFIRTYLERDIPALGPRIPAETLRRFWTMLAHQQSGLLNAAQLASSLGVNGKTIASYLDLLVDLLLVRRLQPWSQNLGKRLVRTPKVYLRDSGLVHALLDIGSWNDLLGHPVVGPSWEAFVIENLIAAAGDAMRPYFFRTEDGAEIDLLFERGGVVDVAVEIKRSTAPTLSRGFHLACAAVRPRQKFLVHGGEHTWPMENGVTATALIDLVRLLAGAKAAQRGHRVRT